MLVQRLAPRIGGNYERGPTVTLRLRACAYPEPGGALSPEFSTTRSFAGRVPERPGLGIELDRAQLASAHELYRKLGLGARDDGIAMRQLIPGWRFDPKRPAFVR